MTAERQARRQAAVNLPTRETQLLGGLAISGSRFSMIDTLFAFGQYCVVRYVLGGSETCTKYFAGFLFGFIGILVNSQRRLAQSPDSRLQSGQAHPRTYLRYLGIHSVLAETAAASCEHRPNIPLYLVDFLGQYGVLEPGVGARYPMADPRLDSPRPVQSRRGERRL